MRSDFVLRVAESAKRFLITQCPFERSTILLQRTISFSAQNTVGIQAHNQETSLLYCTSPLLIRRSGNIARYTHFVNEYKVVCNSSLVLNKIHENHWFFRAFVI